MHSLTLFNHKGGVGKTTLTINIANALADLGQRVLIVDSDPQCNISAFYIDEPSLDAMLGESEGASASGTVWSAIEPVVHGTGDIREIIPKKVGDTVWLAPGDVLLADYEEELPAAWTDSFARKPRGYHVTSSLFRMTGQLASKLRADIVL